MSASIRFSLAPEGALMVLSGYIEPGSDIPSDVFVYENTGSATQLGAYYGVCTVLEYYNITTWNNTVIPMSNNKFVKFAMLRRVLGEDETPEEVKAKITKDLKSFRTAYLAGLTPQVSVVPLG